jgi:hypothetical protein
LYELGKLWVGVGAEPVNEWQVQPPDASHLPFSFAIVEREGAITIKSASRIAVLLEEDMVRRGGLSE